MTALVKSRALPMERWTKKQFPLAVTYKAFKNGVAVIDLATGNIRPGAAAKGLLVIGVFDEDMDATSATKLVNVNFGIEKEIIYYANDTVSPVTLAMRGQLAYMLDDQTATSAAAGGSVLGRIWDVDAVKGVGIERATAGASLSGLGAAVAVAPAYVANDLIIPASVQSGSILDIPTTTGASTVTLPASAPDGTVLYFQADGTKNGHTVQYRDVTGPVNLTAALTASKRHLTICTALNGKWAANAYVAP